MRSLLVHKSGTLPTTGSQSPLPNNDSNKLHRSIARYLQSQAERSMFRDNALIDPHAQR